MSGSADVEIALSAVTDWDALGTEWRALEGRSGASFFQSWSWVGCMAPERYANPVLLRAGHQGRTVALGLFNRQRGWLLDTLWLHETGDPHWDTVFIEHNGLLIDATVATDALRLACLVAARRAPLPHARLGPAPGAERGRRGDAAGRRRGRRGLAPDHPYGADARSCRAAPHRTQPLPTCSVPTPGRSSDVRRAPTPRSGRSASGAPPAPAEAHRFLDALGRAASGVMAASRPRWRLCRATLCAISSRADRSCFPARRDCAVAGCRGGGNHRLSV